MMSYVIACDDLIDSKFGTSIVGAVELLFLGHDISLGVFWYTVYIPTERINAI